MKILAVVASPHLGNTRKIAEAMAQVAPITITDVDHACDYKFSEFDIVGFGSGVYMGKFDKRITELLSGICDKKAYSFVFSTSGSAGFLKNNQSVIKMLEDKNKVVLGSFGCKGYDKFGPFKIIGGINKGRPNDDDFKAAQEFIQDVMKKYENAEGK